MNHDSKSFDVFTRVSGKSCTAFPCNGNVICHECRSSGTSRLSDSWFCSESMHTTHTVEGFYGDAIFPPSVDPQWSTEHINAKQNWKETDDIPDLI